jgi:hypothetical protein
MAVDFENSVDSLSKLDLWFKVRQNQDLYLSDIPEIIRLRWTYFKDNWSFLRETYISLISSYDNPDKLKSEIEAFDRFIESQRNSKVNKNPFDDQNIIYKYYSIFDSTLINSVSTTYEEREIVDSKVNYIKSLTRKDFLEIRTNLEAERDAIADRVDLSDEDYNRVFNRSPQAARVNVKNKDINSMYEIMQAIKSVNIILANYFSLESATVDPFALAKANANNPDIDIASYSSGTLVKINYGEDLKSLAKRTLGDPNKWIDIAIANGLKPPYIDEIGEKIPLISNGRNNQINIGPTLYGAPIIDKLHVGQSILLQSTTQTFPEQRKVQSIKQIPISGEILIEVEGNQDLDRYKLAENANIRIYKPNTANSSVYILIPSQEQLQDTTISETPWFLKSSDTVERRQKVDLSINDNGDLNLNSNSDLQLIYGIENSIQAVKLKLSVEVGELVHHPTYGLDPIAGNTNQDLQRLRNILVDSIVRNIQGDERFSGIERLDVEYVTNIDSKTVTAFSITLIVRLAGSDGLVPITFSVNI